MANKISEQLFEAVDVLIGKRILDDKKDKTILCTIEDTSKAESGEYTVSNASARFTAYSENTKYRVGQNVWVLIPDGDYNNDKLIMSKYTKDSSSPYVYVDPMDSFIDMTDNILDEVADEVGLLANCDYPISILSTGGTGDNKEYKTLKDKYQEANLRLPNAYIDDPKPPVVTLAAATGFTSINITPIQISDLTTKEKPHILNDVDITGYDRIGIQADFKTVFGTGEPISGSYGLCFIIKTEKEVLLDDPRDGYTTQEDLHYFLLDSSQMWGNPYCYNDFFTQTAIIEFDQEEYGTPISVDCYFYQNFDFIGDNQELLPYYVPVNFDAQGNPTEYDYLPKNIFVKNIRMSFGYSVDEINVDTLRLYTNSNTTYVITNQNYPKDLKLRFIYVTDDNQKIVINGIDKLKEYINDIESLKTRCPVIRWYRYRDGAEIVDPRRGDNWEEFYPSEDWFEHLASDLYDYTQEIFQCVLYSNSNLFYYLWLLLNDNETPADLNDFCTQLKEFYEEIYGENFLDDFEFTDADINEKISAAVTAEAEKQLRRQGLSPTSPDWAPSLDALLPQVRAYEEFSIVNYTQTLWAQTDSQEVPSNMLVFKNKENANFLEDEENALHLTSGDDSKGIFNIYEATLAADNQLINPADEFIPRKINATFTSNIPNDVGLADVERFAWYIPKNNTMIKPPIEGKTYNGTRIENEATIALPKYCFSTASEINSNTSLNLTDAERQLFLSRINDYYILVEDWLDTNTPAPTSNITSLIYYIKPRLIKH